jgi:hypothetical protein
MPTEDFNPRRRNRRRGKKELEERITFRADAALLNALHQHCDKQELKPSQVMRLALKEHLLGKVPAMLAKAILLLTGASASFSWLDILGA